MTFRLLPNYSGIFADIFLFFCSFMPISHLAELLSISLKLCFSPSLRSMRNLGICEKILIRDLLHVVNYEELKNIKMVWRLSVDWALVQALCWPTIIDLWDILHSLKIKDMVQWKSLPYNFPIIFFFRVVTRLSPMAVAYKHQLHKCCTESTRIS